MRLPALVLSALVVSALVLPALAVGVPPATGSATATVPAAGPAPGPAPRVIASSTIITSGSREFVVAVGPDAVWGSGANVAGQLTGDVTDHQAATPLLGLPDGVAPEQVAAVGDQTTYVIADGVVYGAGSNRFSQLGPDPDRPRRTLTAMLGVQGVVPARIVGGPTCLFMLGGQRVVRIGSDGASHGCPLQATAGPDYFSLVPGMPAGRDVVDVAAGGETASSAFAVFVMADGSLWGTGSGVFGQLAGTTDLAVATRLPDLPGGAKAVAVSASAFTTVVLSDDGRVFGTGLSFGGQLTGDDDSYFGWHQLSWASDPAPVARSVVAGPLSTYVRDQGGDWHVAGATLGFPHGTSTEAVRSLTPLVLPADFPAVEAVEGLREGMVLRAVDGEVWGWGANLQHRLTGTAKRHDQLRRLDRSLASDAAPSVSGTAAPDEVLTATAGTWVPTPSGTSVQWLRDGQPISGATGATYAVHRTDAGHAIGVRVTASAPGLLPATVPSAAVRVPPRLYLRMRPSIAGRARVGRLLVGRPGAWVNAPSRFRFRWLRDGRPLRGATHRTFRVRRAQLHHRLTLRVTAVRPGYPSEVALSRPTARVRR